MRAVPLDGALGCPSVGRWIPSVARGAHLREGLVLGTLIRLGVRHEVRAPASGGQVTEVSPAGWLQYGEPLVGLGVLDAEAAVSAPEEDHGDLVAVRAPMAGAIYQRPAPGEPPFVAVGAEVKRLETLALMEVMKTFTPIKAEAGGVLERWAVEEGGSVEADAVIAWLRPG